MPPRRILCARIYYLISLDLCGYQKTVNWCFFAETVVVFTASRVIGPRRLSLQPAQAVKPSTCRPVEQPRRVALCRLVLYQKTGV